MSYKQMTGNIISATKVEPVGTSEVGAASGVWNLDDQYDYKRGANWPEAGVANPDTLIENNFAITLYEGNGSTQSITTGIDSVNKSSLVWIKNRDAADSNIFTDTVRGAGKILVSDTSAAEATDADTITAFSSTGFALGDDVKVNTNNESYCSWQFKVAPKFFDIVEYTGNGSAQNIAHNLGSVPGMIIMKRKSTAHWGVYHRSIGGTGLMQLSGTQVVNTDSSFFNDTDATANVFTVGAAAYTGQNAEDYVAYVFGHETGDDSMIQCGTYEGNGNNTGPVINLGWEAQFVLIKNVDAAENWSIMDSMRNLANEVGYNQLLPNNAAAEQTSTSQDWVTATATGFKIGHTSAEINTNNKTYIYMAIRRPNMATITDATEVFAIDGENTAAPYHTSGFPVDFAIKKPLASGTWLVASRLLQDKKMATDATTREADETDASFDFNDGYFGGAAYGEDAALAYMWKRAKGYFDVVAYTGTGSAKTEAHSLGVAPEMMWVKARNTTEDWTVWAGFGNDKYLNLNDDAAVNSDSVTTIWNNTAPTSAVFSVGTHDRTNASGDTYIAYLFATLAGVSKVGSVTHSGSSTDVNCGFSAGARVVMLKRTDDAGSWFWWDSTRGIIAGNDPYFLLDTDAAPVTNTDYIDPLASGFQISGSFQDGDYIFYAIA